MIKETGELSFFSTTGFSMWPFLAGKEKLIIKKAAFPELKLGDLVVYRVGEELICHRLVKKIKGRDGFLYFAKADASFGSAERLKEEQLVGKVSCFIKGSRIYQLEGRWPQINNRLILLVLPLINFTSEIYVKLFVKK